MKKYRKGSIQYLFAALIAIMISGAIVFNLYMGSLKPIKNLDKFIPNYVTQFISSDDVALSQFSFFMVLNGTI